MDRDLDQWSFELRDSKFEFAKQINAARTSTRSPPCPACTRKPG